MRKHKFTIKNQKDGHNHLSEKLVKASKFYEDGNLDKAKQSYYDVLRKHPRHPDLLHIIGLIENETGNPKTAEKYLCKAIRYAPQRENFYINLGQFYFDQDKNVDAFECFKKALLINRECPDIYCHIGDIFRKNKSYDDAINWYQNSIKEDPGFFIAYNKLGNCYQLLNMLDKAFKCYQKVLSLKPDNAKAYHNLGNIYQKMGSFDEAIEYYQKALLQAGDFAEIYDSLGNTYQKKRAYDLAIEAYQKALEIAPDNYLINFHIGKNLKGQGKLSQSKRWLAKSLKLNPNFQPAKIHLLLSLPIIYKSQMEIDSYRMEYAKGIEIMIEDWNESKDENSQQHMMGLNGWTNFFLPYQGKNDLFLQKKIGGYLFSVMKANSPQKFISTKKLPLAKEDRKIRIGYVSEYMCSHTVGKLFFGWVENADHSNFEIYCYHTSTLTDKMTKQYKASCFKFRNIINDIDKIADQIIFDKIDILVYFDIGMNSPTQLLAATRLAPVQCVAWGHPVTTGLPSIDYFLSSELMEPVNGQDHYSETLVKLPNLSISYTKPNLPETPKRRNEFGLKDEEFIYLATQSLFKYLPEDDFIYVQIAMSVRQSKFVFLKHESENVTAIFKRRLELEFQKHHLDYEAFCCFQPRLSYPDFLNLNRVSDVLLDPPAWSGGMTSIEGIRCGLPTVTLPGNFMRCRHTYAILKFAGIHETIAADRKDYIRIASKLGTDIDFYDTCKKSIADNIDKICDDQQAVNELETFYKSLMPTTK